MLRWGAHIVCIFFCVIRPRFGERGNLMVGRYRSIWIACFVVSVLGHSDAQLVEMPDASLAAAVRSELGLAADAPLTVERMLQLTDLPAQNRGIADLTGLEHATGLWGLSLSENPISDVSPLAGLTGLLYLSLRSCQVSDVSPLAGLTKLDILSLQSNREVVDISPLAGLTQLTLLKLGGNKIVDISALVGLTQLEILWLDRNQIVDISPLANLTALVELRLDRNFTVDFSPLKGLEIPNVSIDTLFFVPTRPVIPRLASRDFPSVFAAWGGFGWSPVSNLDHLSDAEQIALHDLWWSPSFGLGWRFTDDGVKLVGDGATAKAEWDAVVGLNPDIILLREVTMRYAAVDYFYRHDFPYWLLDDSGQRVRTTEFDVESYLLDFTDPGRQDVIVEQIVAVAECGLYDGVFIDYWAEDAPVLRDHRVGRVQGQ